MFKELKKIFTTQLVLVVSDLDKKMKVRANASEYIIGGILSMRCEDDK